MNLQARIGTSGMEYKRSESYFHPDGDVYFQTEDEVLFRLPSYVLKTISTVFKDMLSNDLSSMDDSNQKGDHVEHKAKDEGGESDKDETADAAAVPSAPAAGEPTRAIVIEGIAETFEMLLDFALLEHDDHLGDWPIIRTVYDLSEKYDFPVARGRIAKRLFDLAPTAPWEAFVFAGQRDDISLARHALKYMPCESRRDVKLVGMMPDEEAERLPVSWLLAYLTLVARAQYEAEMQWADCALNFQPGKPRSISSERAPPARRAVRVPAVPTSAPTSTPFCFGWPTVRIPSPPHPPESVYRPPSAQRPSTFHASS